MSQTIERPLEILAPDDPGEVALEVMPRADGIERFRPYTLAMKEASTRAFALVILASDPPEERQRKAAEALRLRTDIFRPTRLAAAKLHEEVKQGLLAITQKMDKAEREIRNGCKEAEAHLEEQEEFEAREAARLEQELRTQRSAELSPFLTGPCPVDLGRIPPAEYDRLLADSKDLAALRQKREEEAAAAAQKAREEAEAERERERAELARAKEEAEAAKAAAAKAVAAAEAKAKREREAAAIKVKAEMEAAAKEAREKQAAIEHAAKKERDELKAASQAREAAYQKQLAEERAATQKAEQERAAERNAREAAERARVLAEKEATEKERIAARKKEDEERAASIAPDVEKIKAWAGTLHALQSPTLHDTATAEELRQKHSAYVKWVIRAGTALKDRP